MIQPAYVGYPDQHSHVVAEIKSAVERTPSGIFVVGGPGRVGKNTAIQKVVERLNLSGSKYREISPRVNMQNDSPNDYFSMWERAYSEGSNTFVFGEIPVNFENSLAWVGDFYSRGINERRKPKILFNVISRNYPAWEGDLVQDNIQSVLEKTIPKDLKLELLNADTDRIIEELWRFRESRVDMMFLLGEMGLSTEIAYEADFNHFGNFEGYIREQMGKYNPGRERR